MDGLVGLELVRHAAAVLGDEEGQAVALPQLAQRGAQAHGVDAHAVGGHALQRVVRALRDARLGHHAGHELRHVVRRHLLALEALLKGGALLVGDVLDRGAAVVVEGDEVGLARLEDLLVAGLEIREDTLVLHEGRERAGVLAKDGRVEVEAVAQLVEVHGRQVVLGARGQGVDAGDVGCRGDPVLRAHLVAERHGLGLCEQHVVVGLVALLVRLVAVLVEHDHHVLLVDGQPVLDLVAVLLEAHAAVADEVVDALTAGPAAVLLLQRLRQVEVVEGHDGRDAVSQAGVDHVVVVGDARGVDLAVTVGDDARPGDREAELVEARLGHEGDVLLVAVIVVGGHLPVGVARDDRRHVLDREPLAVLVPGALALVRGAGPTPEEPLGERLELQIVHTLPFSWGSGACPPGRHTDSYFLISRTVRASASPAHPPIAVP